MKMTILGLSAMLALTLAVGFGPTSAFADENAVVASASSPMGTVETDAVTAPILIGGIMYIPRGLEVAAAVVSPSMGTIQTDAVTSPIVFGPIIYIP